MLLIVLGVWGRELWRLRPRNGNYAADLAGMACWCAAFSAWFVTLAIGLVNTTMHHEHAMLAVLTLVLWLEPDARS